MKRLFLPAAVLLAALVAASGWWLLRRSPGGPPDDAGGTSFAVESMANGWLIQHKDEQLALRALRWLPARGDGVLLAQVITQNDEQQVHLFKNGLLLGSWKLERPDSVKSGFFRFAELQDAVLLEGEALLLLYGSRSRTEQDDSLLVALDAINGSLRWHLRLGGSRLALSADVQKPSLFVWGSPNAVHRIILQRGPGKPPTPALIDLPSAAASPSDLLPTGAGSFLLAHPQGLSAFSEGWSHHPLPPRPSWPSFPGNEGRLARSSAGLFWQPFPGVLLEVKSGGALAELPLAIGPGENLARDLKLLRLLGADARGDLWFGLANPGIDPPPNPAPALLPAGAAGETAGSEPGPPVLAAKDELPPAPGPSPEEVPAWRQHLAGGLGRLYRQPRGGGPVRRYDWPTLWRTWPEAGGRPVPQGDADLRPESGLFVIGSGRKIWWLPLQALGDGAPPIAVPQSQGPR